MAEGTSILDNMAAGVMEKKVDKAAKLTLLAGEAPNAPVLIPNHPLGDLGLDPDIQLGRLAAAESELLLALEAIRKLQTMYGKPESILEHDAEVSQKAIEKEKDRRVNDAAKAAEPIVKGMGPVAKAGIEMAAARVATQSPIEDLMAGEDARLAKRREVLAAMAGVELQADPDDPESIRQAIIAAPTGTAEAIVERLKGVEQQAAVFGTPAPDKPTVPNDLTWRCPAAPEHVVEVRTSARRGISYYGCTECSEFQKL